MEKTLVSKTKKIHGAIVQGKAENGASSFLRCPIQWLYPIKVQHGESFTRNYRE